MRGHCGHDCLLQHIVVVAESLQDSDRVNDSGSDSHLLPLCAQIYTAEVKTDKLAPRGIGLFLSVSSSLFEFLEA